MNAILVLGARPQFIKAAPVAAALTAAGLTARVLHTGQHYDFGMSAVFFAELGIPAPEWNLNCGGGTHGAMTGAMLREIEKVLMGERPDITVVFGDTNSTLAGALAAAKLHIPVAHVEAGLRSGNRRMPEELNRICTDHLSDLLFCSSEAGRVQLAAEGITRGVHVTGDVMADAFYLAQQRADAGGRPTQPFAILTLHRAENTENPDNLRRIFTAVERSKRRVVFPVHPRTKKLMAETGIVAPASLECREPCGYLEMAALLSACELVMTDSGGLQKEAYWAGKPCLTLRTETEWTELVEAGWNVVTGTETAAILKHLQSPAQPGANYQPGLYGDGKSAVRVVSLIQDYLAVSPS